MKPSLSFRHPGSIITLLNYYTSFLFQWLDKCVTVQFISLLKTSKQLFPMWEMVRGVNCLEFIPQTNCFVVKLSHEIKPFSIPTDWLTLLGGETKWLRQKWPQMKTLTSKEKVKDFLQSNSAQMDSAWTLLLHSIKFIKTESEADREREIDWQKQKESCVLIIPGGHSYKINNNPPPLNSQTRAADQHCRKAIDQAD